MVDDVSVWKKGVGMAESLWGESIRVTVKMLRHRRTRVLRMSIVRNAVRIVHLKLDRSKSIVRTRTNVLQML